MVAKKTLSDVVFGIDELDAQLIKRDVDCAVEAGGYDDCSDHRLTNLKPRTDDEAALRVLLGR